MLGLKHENPSNWMNINEDPKMKIKIHFQTLILINKLQQQQQKQYLIIS